MGRNLTDTMLLATLLLFAGFGDAFDLERLLSFCQSSSSPCRNNKQDLDFQNQMEQMDIPSSSCKSLIDSVLCSKCNSSNLRSPASVGDFCSKLWKSCHSIPISDPATANSHTSYKLSDVWESDATFCEEFGGNSPSVNGGRVLLSNSSHDETSQSGICLEKIGNEMYLNMVPHPDGSSRVFLANQAGKVWLARVPEQGSEKTLSLNESSPFIDISDWVYNKGELGMMGVAFHPQFLKNGRFFLSYNCDKISSPRCSGRCSCNSDLSCDPTSLPTILGIQPCQFQSVISEFSVNGTASQPYLATYAFPKEVRRTFTMGLPFTTHHGGQILFGPEDRYLYFMMGDGGGTGDPYNFAQNKKSLLGKIMRLDVDSILNENTSALSGAWGNYSIPGDNPYKTDKQLQPEIWALGFRNPWRCSFDLKRPSYFLCADVGQDTYEEVDIVKKGGNYGWRVYEGPNLYKPPSSPGGNTPANSINPIFPVMGYKHPEGTKSEGSASITGGHFYRSTADPCLDGRYIFGDLYAGAIWTGTESPENSDNFTETMVNVGCAADSPIPCTENFSSRSLGYVLSFGQDNRKDSFILTATGVYRVVRPSRCKFFCSKDNATAAPVPSSHSPPPPAKTSDASAMIRSGNFLTKLVQLLVVVYIVAMVGD